jgi:CheY-like chemotaxis protein
MIDKTLKILHVEDNPADARLIREMLKDAPIKFDLTHVENLSNALERLREDEFDVLLLDLNLPDVQGLETLNKAIAQAPPLPIVVLTGLADAELGVTAIRGGVEDYLTKGQINTNLLVHTISYAIERWQLKTERKSGELTAVDSVKKALQLLNELQERFSTLSHDSIALDHKTIFEFNSVSEYNEFSFNIKKINNVHIDDVQIFENKYVVTVAVSPKSYHKIK